MITRSNIEVRWVTSKTSISRALMSSSAASAAFWSLRSSIIKGRRPVGRTVRAPRCNRGQPRAAGNAGCAPAPLRGERGRHSARGERMPGTLRDEDVREGKEVAPALPRTQVAKGVRAEEQNERTLRAEFASQPLERFDGVAGRGL